MLIGVHRPSYRPDIQGIRGVAVVMVVLFHAGLPVRGGFTGVDVFFVVSGFVITRLLWTEYRSTERISLVAFYSARARRLLPALAVLLVVVAVAAAFLQGPLEPQANTGRTGIAAGLYVANIQLLYSDAVGYFTLAADSNPLLHTWTLAVEEQFYVLFPITIVAALYAARRWRRSAVVVLTVTIGALLLVSLALCVKLTHASVGAFGNSSANQSAAFYLAPTRAWEFGAGALLALHEERLRALSRWLGQLAGGVGAALVVVSALAVSRDGFPGLVAVVPVTGAALLITSSNLRPTVVTAVLSWRPLRWLGDVSYGWYLWHWPAIVLTRAVRPGVSSGWLLAVAVLSLVPAVASYRLVEGRFRFDRRIVGVRALRLAAVCLVTPILFHGALVWSTKHPTAAVRDLNHQLRVHEHNARGCKGNLPADAVTLGACTWRAPAARGQVILLGDSQAAHFTEPVRDAAKALDLDLTVAVLTSCPFVELDVHGPNALPIDQCHPFVEAWLSYAERAKPALVVIATAASSYISDPSFTIGADAVSDPRAKAARWESGTSSLLRRLDRAGVGVVVVHQIPAFRSFDLRLCPAVSVYRHSCNETRPRSEVDELRRLSVQAERDAAEGLARVTTLDLADHLCSPTECRTRRGRTWVYRDWIHLTVDGATELAPQFEQAMKSRLSSG